ncbi:replicative DNA helicase [Pseudaeromonas paramecii]|uniref:DNA 5'-3' helicase n=1 Tax=Pseudaeromonas paramecii TaxID=2138166 RepID=A0ABP8PXG7_9GAMM
MTNAALHNHDTEQAVLGGLILACQNGDEKRIAATTGLLKPASFYSAPHRMIYAQILALLQANQPVDVMTLDARLKSVGEDDRAGGFAYLVELVKNIPSAANLVAHARLVRDYAVRRYAMGKLADATELLSTASGDPVADQITAIHGILAEINDYASTGERRGLRHVREISQHWIDDLEKRQTQPDYATGFTSGIPSLDKLIAPKNIPAGSLVVVGARPKMGKSALMVSVMDHFADTHGGVAAFSLEMPDDQIWERYIAQKSRVNANRFYTGMDDAEWGALSSAMGVALDRQLFIDDTPGISLSHIQREVRRLRADGVKLSLIAVDYLTLMQAEKAERNDLAYGLITKGLKALAKEIDGVVLLLTQLNRNLESRSDKRPMPSDSRDTGQIEQDCDMWIGLYRDDVYHEDSPYAGTIEMILRMNRHGGSGTAVAGFHAGQIIPLEQSVMETMRANAEEAAAANRKPYKRGGFDG